jgi:RHS repeat-associated protein
MESPYSTYVAYCFPVCCYSQNNCQFLIALNVRNHTHKFCGGEYNNMRDYDATLGRYIESDPIGLNGGTNLYGYAGQNPAQGIDPWGLDTYKVNRNLGIVAAIFGPSSEPRTNWRTHTFTMTTNPACDCVVDNTYSWGNNGLKGIWNQNQPIDLTTGAGSTKWTSRKGRRTGPRSLCRASIRLPE